MRSLETTSRLSMFSSLGRMRQERLVAAEFPRSGRNNTEGMMLKSGEILKDPQVNT